MAKELIASLALVLSRCVSTTSVGAEVWSSSSAPPARGRQSALWQRLAGDPHGRRRSYRWLQGMGGLRLGDVLSRPL